jgi:Chaperone of endosialidase
MSPGADSNNIDIGYSYGGGESDTIRIGSTQTETFVAGIAGTSVTGGDAVVVSSAGQLGIVTSSARYKHDIHDMGPASDGLLKLRPVTFRYNDDPQATRQYGLVAEEVARLYPELVGHGADGKPQTVRYLELTSMLLAELQSQARRHQVQGEEIRYLDHQNKAQAALNQRLSTEIAQLQGMFEQLMATRRKGRSTAATFNH